MHVLKAGHRYVSTACHHKLHDDCRKTCKFCTAKCTCKCHKPASVVAQPAASGCRDLTVPEPAGEPAAGEWVRFVPNGNWIRVCPLREVMAHQADPARFARMRDVGGEDKAGDWIHFSVPLDGRNGYSTGTVQPALEIEARGSDPLGQYWVRCLGDCEAEGSPATVHAGQQP